MSVAALLVYAASAVCAPQGPADLESLARRDAQPVLEARARARPDDTREAIRSLLARSVAPTGDSVAAFRAAARLAEAYAGAWSDSFLLRQVARFRAWPLAARRVKLAADSLRRVGNDAFARTGLAAATDAWHASLQRCRMLQDTAGTAAALGNLGAAFYEAGALDSAVVYLARARTLAQRAGDLRVLGNAVGLQAAVAKQNGDVDGARALHQQAITIRQRSGDDRGLAADHNNLGLLAQSLGEAPAARVEFNRALDINRRSGRSTAAATNLLNLGNLASESGRYGEAAARYAEARAAYERASDVIGRASVLHNVGLLRLRRGDFSGAIDALAGAFELYRTSGLVRSAALVGRDMAVTRAAAGRLDVAASELGRAEHLAPADAPGLQADLALTGGDLALEFNALPEAAARYARAEELYRRARDQGGQAEALQGLAIVSLLRGDSAVAATTAEQAATLLRTAGDPRRAVAAQLLLGYVQLRLGDRAAARRTFSASRGTLGGRGDVIVSASILAALGDVEAADGHPAEAEAHYRSALSELGSRVVPELRWRLHAGLGDARRRHGDLVGAARELRTALREIERFSAVLGGSGQRAGYLADKWDVYAQLALIESTRGRPAAAFEASERLRAREMLGVLALGRLKTTAPTEDPLLVREQDLRRRMGDLSAQVTLAESHPPGLRGSLRPPGGDTRAAAELADAEAAYRELLDQLRVGRTAYASLVRPEIVGAGTVARLLGPERALLEYLVCDSTTIVFVVTSDTVAALDLSVDRRTLAGLVDFWRATLTRPGAPATRDAWKAPARRLYARLVQPIEAAGLLSGRRTLLIAPHGELHYLPFAALLRPGNGEQFLVERYDVAYVPSASVWTLLPARAASPGDAALAMAPSIAALPGTQQELAAVAREYQPRARVLVGAASSERTLREEAPGRAIIHLATTGVLNRHNPLYSYVELVATDGDDGQLEVREVFALRLDARLVVLSACQTGLGAGIRADVPAGDDWVGLVRAFLFAGASNVVATLWPVADRESGRLMERFYANLRSGGSVPRALADAQRAALRDVAMSHPFYWAGFAAVGRGS